MTIRGVGHASIERGGRRVRPAPDGHGAGLASPPRAGQPAVRDARLILTAAQPAVRDRPRHPPSGSRCPHRTAPALAPGQDGPRSLVRSRRGRRRVRSWPGPVDAAVSESDVRARAPAAGETVETVSLYAAGCESVRSRLRLHKVRLYAPSQCPKPSTTPAVVAERGAPRRVEARVEGRAEAPPAADPVTASP